MLERADRSLEEVIRVFAERGIEVGFVVPTETGLDKSIMDAHTQLRDYLASSNFHNYDVQAKGQNSKVRRRAWIIGIDNLEETTVSLYRPETKKGDPRIWVSGLSRRVRPYNLLALFVFEGDLYLVNTSAPRLLETIYDGTTPLGRLVDRIVKSKRAVADELLGKLRDISSLGFVKSHRSGDTGVGMTLETLLGIAANSSKLPDYKGIELKAARAKERPGSENRLTLFSKAPEWKRSNVGTAIGLLQTYGYDRDGRRQLYCTLGRNPNPQGLFLEVANDDLAVLYGSPAPQLPVVRWGMPALRSTLASKHHETFWVKARRRTCADGEYFHYTSVVHTRAPLLANFDALLDRGIIEVDFLMHLLTKPDGSPLRARDHGYLFKIDPKNLPLLFPPPVHHDLCETINHGDSFGQLSLV